MSFSNCRTCLESEAETKLVNIAKKCWLEKSIKDVIIRIVPEMSSTLSDEDFVCKKCLGIIELSIDFIKTCLEVEATIAESKAYLQINKIDDDFWQDDYKEASAIEVNESSSIEDEENEEQENNSSNMLLSPKSEITDLDHDYCVNSSPKLLSNLLFPPTSYCSDEESNEAVKFIPTDNITPQFHSEVKAKTVEFNEVKAKDIFDTITNNGNIENIDFMCMENTELIFLEIQSDPNKNSIENVKDHQDYTNNHKNEPQHSSQEKSQKEKDPYVCEVCGQICKNLHNLKQHKVGHITERMYMCDKCPKNFKSSHQLSKHIKRSHEKVTRRQCDECGKLFWDSLSLRNHHRLVHLKEKPFVCCICNAGFGRKDYMKKHMAKHTGLVAVKSSRGTNNPRGHKNPKYGVSLRDTGHPVPCKICGRLIKSVHLLKAHLETHIKIKRFKCKFCNLSFTSPSNRDRHQKGHAADPENKFRCNICWKRLKTEEELTYHVSMHENRPPRHCCDICGEKFHRKYLLHNHYTEEHTTSEDIERAQNEIVTKNLLEYAKDL